MKKKLTTVAALTVAGLAAAVAPAAASGYGHGHESEARLVDVEDVNIDVRCALAPWQNGTVASVLPDFSDADPSQCHNYGPFGAAR